MTAEEIRHTKEMLYGIIARTKHELEELRKSCPHEHTFSGNWEWRIGATFPAIICNDCGEMVKSLMPEFEAIESDNEALKP